MGIKLRRFISCRGTFIFGLKPCPIEKAFPSTEQDRKTNSRVPNLDTQDGAEGSNLDTECLETSGQPSTDDFQRNLDDKKTNFKVLARSADEMTPGNYADDEHDMTFLWQYLATIMDRFFLYVHIIVSIVIFAVFNSCL